MRFQCVTGVQRQPPFARLVSTSPRLVVAFAAAVVAIATPVDSGCSSDPVCRDYSPPATFDAQQPVMTFSKDVMPIFSQSCTFTSCHGSISGSNNLLLGG